MTKNTAEARPDLIHPFQFLPAREDECSHYYLWLGGYVKCKAKESDPIHHGGPHSLTAPDGEKAYCKGSPDTCEACFQEFRLEKLTEDMQDRCRSRRRLRDMTGVEFGEALADMAKAVERSRK